MHWFSLGVALLTALGIIGIGVGYLTRPLKMAPSFGLPSPEDAPNVAWWLRLKGTRDVAAGVLVLAFMAMDRHQALGLVLLILAIIPFGDMSTVVAAKGKTATAFGVHGFTTALMIVAAIPLLTGSA